MGVQSLRNSELRAARLYEEPVRARPRDGWIERRHRRGGGGQPGSGRVGHGYGELDPRAIVAPGAGGHPFDDGPDQPRRGFPAGSAGRYCGTDHPDGGRCREDSGRGGGCGSGRCGYRRGRSALAASATQRAGAARGDGGRAAGGLHAGVNRPGGGGRIQPRSRGASARRGQGGGGCADS